MHCPPLTLTDSFPERVSVLDLKEAAAPRFDHGDVVFCLFLETNIKVPPVSHQQKRLIKGICSTFEMKSNYFDPVIAKKVNKF